MKPKPKNSIPRDRTKEHPTLAGLTKKFRESAKWFEPKAPPKSDEMELMMLRRPNEEPDPSKGSYLVAVNRKTFKGSLDGLSLERLLLDMIKRVRPSPPDWYKAGAVIRDHLQLEIDPGRVADMLGLDRDNEQTARAVLAALLGTFATSSDGIDLEPVVFALGAFIHAHPRFTDLIIKDKWHLPFGARTAYALRRRALDRKKKPRRRR